MESEPSDFKILEDLILEITKSLVDVPDEVNVTGTGTSTVVVFEIKVNPSDVGKVIGREGRTITAIRTIIANIAAKNGQRCEIELIDPRPRQPATFDHDSL